jgi:ABC-2 type transport system ATP-binding protein
MCAEQAVEVSHVLKRYGDKAVVNDLSFTVNQGEIFGLIGPNGAGKTTTIRMMMDIIKPDSGQITFLGKHLDDNSKNKVGYMPEERGLYRKLRVIDSITYLAELKGLSRQKAEQRAEELLKQTEMLQHKNKKIEELSKGMGQIIQFLVTVVHNPDLVILDEPFSGLDPVNTELLKSMFIDLKNKGKAVILSTHRMNEIEESCDRILMVNNGRSVLYGSLADIKAKYRSNAVLVETGDELGDIPGVISRRRIKNKTELILDEKTYPQQVLEEIVKRRLTITRYEIATPPLNEIFLKVVGKNHE